MINESDINEFARWDAEYTHPELSVFWEKVVESPFTIGSRALNVFESLTRMVADVLPPSKQDEHWGDYVIGSRFLTIGLGLVSNLSVASHKSKFPAVEELNKWHSLWCSPHPNPIPSDWKLIMDVGYGNKYNNKTSHLLDSYTLPFINTLADELKNVEDTQILSQCSNYNVRYRLKKSEYKTFTLGSSSHPFVTEQDGNASLYMLCESKELVIIKNATGSYYRVLGSTKASQNLYKSFSQYVLSVIDREVEVYKFGQGMSLYLNDFKDKHELINNLSKRICTNPSKLAFLAVGKPGTGKTQFSLCLANELLIPNSYLTMIVSIKDLLSFKPPNWLKKVCLICNDADLLLLSRDTKINRWSSMKLGDMETCMQLLDNTLNKSLVPVRVDDKDFNTKETPSIIYIITSNIEACHIDPALLRPGRIDITEEFIQVYDSHKSQEDIKQY